MKAIAFLFLCALFFAEGLDNGLGLYPPMGWNTWCTLGKCGKDFCNADEVYSVAQEMVKNGMDKIGYEYVNLDDCWADTRDAQGNIQADPSRFPGGMKVLIDKIHALGLKFGLYTCAGTYTCSSGGRNHSIPGSYGHYQQDANSYASWGVDFVKMDWCNTDGLSPKVQYPEFSKALNNTGRPIYFEMCEWGVDDPWTWAQPVANQWRTTGDHHDNWASTVGVIEAQVGLSKYSGEGAWNYLDFIYTGGQGCSDDPHKHCPGQTDTEYITEFSFWAFLNSGLIVATDIRIMTPIMKTVLFNTEVIALNKDPLRKEGDRVSATTCCGEAPNALQVWARPLADGSEAVLLFNAGLVPHSIAANFQLWGWGGASAHARDLWQHRDMGIFNGMLNITVPSHGVVLVKLTKAQ